MTSNLLHGGTNADDFRRVLDQVKPDVVVTQELGQECADVLTSRFRNHHLHPADDFTGRGIATDLDVEFGDIPMPIRYGTSAILDVGGEPWDLAGIHLVNPINFPWWASVRTRTEQLHALEQWRSEATGPIMAAGDFNASPRWPAYRYMAERWDDVVAEHASLSGRRPQPTWAWRPGWRRMLRIDHVFGSGVVATDAAVVPIPGSDHAAVWVDLVAE